jgi:hypothetical protein
LQLFCTRNFEVIAKSASAALLQRITSLYIEIADGTGPRGSHEYDSTYGSHEYYESDTLFSNVQTRHPNVKHHKGVFDLMATHHFDLDLLNWEREMNTLQIVYLRRVKASELKLLRVLKPGLSQTRESFALSGIQLVKVELKDGSWQNVTEHLATLASLSRCVCSG